MAIFESWHIEDGNYPPLHEGQLVNLSFELEPKTTTEISLGIPENFEHLGKGEYRFCATAIRVYEDADDSAIAILETGDFRFYIMADKSNRYVQGRRYCGEGTLLLDHYSWVEYLSERENPPDLFYKLKVNQILKVNIPEKFIARHETGKSLPTRLIPEDYSAADVEEINTMQGQPFDEEFYVIGFDSLGLEGRDIPRTFLS